MLIALLTTALVWLHVPPPCSITKALPRLHTFFYEVGFHGGRVSCECSVIPLVGSFSYLASFQFFEILDTAVMNIVQLSHPCLLPWDKSLDLALLDQSVSPC